MGGGGLPTLLQYLCSTGKNHDLFAKALKNLTETKIIIWTKFRISGERNRVNIDEKEEKNLPEISYKVTLFSNVIPHNVIK